MKRIDSAWLWIGAVPVLCYLPYLLTAWRGSPLDRWDWLYWLAAMGLGGLGSNRIRRWFVGFDWRGGFFLAAALLVMAVGYWKPVNALYLFGALGFAAAVLYVGGGRKVFCGTLPLFGIAALGVPGTSFWIGNGMELLGCGGIAGWGWKMIFGGMLALWFAVRREPVRLGALVYGGGLAILAVGMVMRLHPSLYGAPLHLTLTAQRLPGDWLGMEEPLTDLDRRFFGESPVTKKIFFQGQQSVALLGIALRGEVHRIHPAAICMKSAGWNIIESRQVVVTTKAGPLAVLSIEAERDGRTYLVYAWYVGPHWSSGSFTAFRRDWSADESWFSYQLMTPITGNREEAARRLLRFIDAVMPSEPGTGAPRPSANAG